MKPLIIVFGLLLAHLAQADALLIVERHIKHVDCELTDSKMIELAQKETTRVAFSQLSAQGCSQPLRVSAWRSKAWQQGWPYMPEFCRSKHATAKASFGCMSDSTGGTVEVLAYGRLDDESAMQVTEKDAAFFCDTTITALRLIKAKRTESPYGGEYVLATFSCEN